MRVRPPPAPSRRHRRPHDPHPNPPSRLYRPSDHHNRTPFSLPAAPAYSPRCSAPRCSHNPPAPPPAAQPTALLPNSTAESITSLPLPSPHQEPSMKITDLRIHPVQGRHHPRFPMVFVEVVTDSGLVGLGESLHYKTTGLV